MSSNSPMTTNSSSTQLQTSLHPEQVEYDSFDSFGALPYLQEYYSTIDHENDELLRFYAAHYATLPPQQSLLEFSGGPTIYSLISAATRVETIHFSDFLALNRNEVRKWIYNKRHSFDWHHFIKRALEHEGNERVDDSSIATRVSLLREKISKIVQCNAFRKFNLRHNSGKQYDVVNVNFVPESITSEKALWEQAIKNISMLVKPCGYLFITSLKNSHYYLFDGKKFPALRIQEDDLLEVLAKNGFETDSAIVHSIEAHPFRGYEGMIFIRIQKCA